MRKVGFLSTFALVVSLTATAFAGSIGKATGGQSNTTGVGNDTAHRSFTAQGSKNGAKGQFQVKVTDDVTGAVLRRYHGEVDCYRQEGKNAWFSGPVTNSQGNPVTNVDGQFFIAAVRDNGEGPDAPPDLVSSQRSLTPVDCQTSTLQPTQPVETGNIQVH